MLFFGAFSHRISETPKGRFCYRNTFLCPTFNISKRLITVNGASAVGPGIIVYFLVLVERTTSCFLTDPNMLITDTPEKADVYGTHFRLL